MLEITLLGAVASPPCVIWVSPTRRTADSLLRSWTRLLNKSRTVHYHIHNSPPLAPNLSHMDLVRDTVSCFWPLIRKHTSRNNWSGWI